MIPAIPAWDGVNTLFSFFLTSLFLGPLFVAALWRFVGNYPFIYRVFHFVPYGYSHLSCCLFFFIVAGFPEAVETAKLTFNHFLFWIRIVTFLAAFALLVLAYKNHKLRNIKVYSAAFAVLLVSEFFARFLFYETAIHL